MVVLKLKRVSENVEFLYFVKFVLQLKQICFNHFLNNTFTPIHKLNLAIYKLQFLSVWIYFMYDIPYFQF